MNLQRLFDYDHWANHEEIVLLRSLESGLAHRLLAHILSAQSLWLSRLRGEPGREPVWPEWSIERCTTEIDRLHAEWTRFLASADLNADIRYRNTKGEEHVSRVEDVLMHVVIHGAYHRGQIATVVRQGGALPPYTDFIHCTRMKFI